MKECSRCKITKSVDNFYKHNRYGYQYICKDCNRVDYRNRRKLNPDKFIAKDKRYYQRHSLKKREYIQRYGKDHPDKINAKNAVRIAIRNGSLVPVKCLCGEMAEAHHPDYSKPLEVMWLCKRCHRSEHGLVK